MDYPCLIKYTNFEENLSTHFYKDGNSLAKEDEGYILLKFIFRNIGVQNNITK